MSDCNTVEELDFIVDFNPQHYYRRIREMGVPQDVAKQVTHFYNQQVFTPLVDLYRWKYRVVEDSQNHPNTKGGKE